MKWKWLLKVRFDDKEIKSAKKTNMSKSVLEKALR